MVGPLVIIIIITITFMLKNEGKFAHLLYSLRLDDKIESVTGGLQAYLANY
jgi:hypothetical protein